MASEFGNHRRRGSLLRKYAVRIAILAIPVGVLCAVFAGCSSDPVRRYRTLSMFFDGVPVPPEIAPPEPSARDLRGEPNAPAVAGARAAGPAGPQIIYHKPYKNRQCSKCHSQTTGFQVPVDRDVCRTCHQSYFDLPADDWIHGPLVVSPCSMCHLPHQSNYYALLKKPENDVCLGCHDPTSTLAMPFHAPVRDEGKRCGSCHDPHSAGNRLLLVDSVTYKRRAFEAKVESAPHAKWPKTECKKCHTTEKSNVLRPADDINKTCLSCHEQKVIKDVPPARLHQAVREGKCISCHTPHRSTLAHLIRPVAEKNCEPCHPVEKFNKPPHPNVIRGNCLLCHNGHVYQRPHLLRPAEMPHLTDESWSPAVTTTRPASTSQPDQPTTEPASTGPATRPDQTPDAQAEAADAGREARQP